MLYQQICEAPPVDRNAKNALPANSRELRPTASHRNAQPAISQELPPHSDLQERSKPATHTLDSSLDLDGNLEPDNLGLDTYCGLGEAFDQTALSPIMVLNGALQPNYVYLDSTSELDGTHKPKQSIWRPR